MPCPYRNPHLPPAAATGDDDLSAMDPHSHVSSRNKKTVAVAAELPFEPPVDPHPVPHGYSPGQFYTPVADGRIGGKKFGCPQKQDLDPFPCYFFC
jgi:hypothetical protein